MKIKDFPIQSRRVSGFDLDNFFDVYSDKRGNYAFNLNSRLDLDLDGTPLETYVTTHDLHPTVISYNIYGTTRLAWLICRINGIDDPSYRVPSGTGILYVPGELLDGLVSFMRQ